MLTIKKWILENYEAEETELKEGAPTKSKENYYAICNYVMDMFMREKLGAKVNPGEVNKYNFYDWAQGFPGILNTSDIFLGIEGIRKICIEVFGTLEGFKEENRELYEKKIIGLHEAYFDIKGNKGHASLVAGIDEEAGDVDSMYQLVLQRKGNLSAIEDEMDGK